MIWSVYVCIILFSGYGDSGDRRWYIFHPIHAYREEKHTKKVIGHGVQTWRCIQPFHVGCTTVALMSFKQLSAGTQRGISLDFMC